MLENNGESNTASNNILNTIDQSSKRWYSLQLKEAQRFFADNFLGMDDNILR